MAEGLFVHRSAEHGNDGIGKNEIHRRQHQTADHCQAQGVAYASLCRAVFLPAQADADKSAAAVPDHNRDGQGHHRQREHHRIGGIAVGAKVDSVGNEYLIDDIIQRAHQQRDHAGHRVFCHQLFYPLDSEILIGFFHSFLKPPVMPEYAKNA